MTEASNTPSVLPTNVVYWEDDPSRTRVVKRICSRCQRFEEREFGQRVTVENVAIVSPSGIGHVQGEGWNDDHTACGKDATGLDWWWRL